MRVGMHGGTGPFRGVRFFRDLVIEGVAGFTARDAVPGLHAETHDVIVGVNPTGWEGAEAVLVHGDSAREASTVTAVAPFSGSAAVGGNAAVSGSAAVGGSVPSSGGVAVGGSVPSSGVAPFSGSAAASERVAVGGTSLRVEPADNVLAELRPIGGGKVRMRLRDIGSHSVAATVDRNDQTVKGGGTVALSGHGVADLVLRRARS